MSNFTPINISSLLRETGGVDPRFVKTNRGGFDKVFFPFSIMVLILSLSIYAAKLMVDITTVPTQAMQETRTPKEIMEEFTSKITPSPTPSPVVEKMYQEIGQIVLDSKRVRDTSVDFYPNMDESDKVRLTKKSLIEWATLLKYYNENVALKSRLSIDTSYPVATFGAVLKDLDIMKRSFQSKPDTDNQIALDELVDEFIKNTSIRTEP